MTELWAILFDWRLFLELGILFTAIYLVLYYLRNTHGTLVIAGFLMVMAVLTGVARVLNLEVITGLMEMFYGSLLLLLLIILQPELRRALAQLGNLMILEKRRRKDVIAELLHAVQSMAKRKCGALIVVECKMRLQTLIDDAIPLDAKVNGLLLESIFFPNSPLHDGAVIIRDDRIVAARAILPLTRTEISRQLGTRHRAAQGIAEESDAVTVIVSEESGGISIAHGGRLYQDLSAGELYKMLDTLVVKKDAAELSETVRQISELDGDSADFDVDGAADRKGGSEE